MREDTVDDEVSLCVEQTDVQVEIPIFVEERLEAALDKEAIFIVISSKEPFNDLFFGRHLLD